MQSIKKQFLVRGIRWILVILLLALSLISVQRSIFLALRDKGSWDFHAFWYAGHFILQHNDPYYAYSQKEEPRLPIAYVDGVMAVASPVAVSNFPTMMPYTPPLMLLMTPLSSFSWSTAKMLWMICNFLFAVAIPLLVLRLPLLRDMRLGHVWQAIAVLFFYNMIATKLVIEAGQTTLAVFFFIVCAIVLVNKSKLLAGICLGIALSKYSVAFPLAIYFLYKREFAILVIGAVTQVAGFFILSLLATVSPLETVIIYLQTIYHYYFLQVDTRLPYTIHLANLFPRGSFLSPLSSVVLTGVIGGLLIKWQRTFSRAGITKLSLIDWHVLTILLLWSLLIVYHGDYDVVFSIFFIVLAFLVIKFPSVWGLKGWERYTLLTLTVMLMLVSTSVYTNLFYLLFPNFQNDITPRTMTISVIFMLLITLGLLNKLAVMSESSGR